MPLNTDVTVTAPEPRTVKPRKTGNKEKSKNASTNQQAKAASTTCSNPGLGDGSEVAVQENENKVMERIAKAKEELKALEAQKEALSKEITEASAATSVAIIERPARGVGIQEGMGLLNNKPKYDAIRRLVRDLVGEVGINWEVPWAEIPAVKKSKLYQAAHEEAPFLKRFANDWPMQALAMQLLKNKRCHSYHCSYLEVPDKYAYLKDNAAKKKPQASRSVEVTPSLGGEEDDGNSTNMPTVASVASATKEEAEESRQCKRTLYDQRQSEEKKQFGHS
ncbi:hypothetical protein V8E53_002586 [Lactarius tabidus]